MAYDGHLDKLKAIHGGGDGKSGATDGKMPATKSNVLSVLSPFINKGKPRG